MRPGHKIKTSNIVIKSRYHLVFMFWFLVNSLYLACTISFAGIGNQYSSEPLTIRFGFTTFQNNKQNNIQAPGTFPSIKSFLKKISIDSRKLKEYSRPLDFTLYVGNYYQVITWLEDNKIDAAVVPPVIAKILIDKNLVIPIVEFSERNEYLNEYLKNHIPNSEADHRLINNFKNNWARDGHWPLIASNKVAEDKGAVGINPIKGYEEYLKCLLDEAIKESKNGCPNKTRVSMVAHLSASGFVVPVVFAERWLRRNIDRMGLKGKSDEIETQYWKSFFDNVDFSFVHLQDSGTEGPGVSFSFTYSGMAKQEIERNTTKIGYGPWQPYSLQLLGPVTPNDVLVVSKNFIRSKFQVTEDKLKDWFPIRNDDKPLGNGSGYQYVKQFNVVRHKRFWDLINTSFKNSKSDYLSKLIFQVV